MSWYNTGFDGLNKADQEAVASYQPSRFWLRLGDTKDVIFVDDSGFEIKEHNPRYNGTFKNWRTCGRGYYPEAICCQAFGKPYYVAYFTIVDCTEWKDRNDNLHKFELSLLPARYASAQKFKRKKEDKGALAGMQYKVSRDNDKVAIGDDWEFNKDVNMEKMFDVVCFRGSKLKDVFAKAEKDPEEMKKLKKWFNLDGLIDSKGKIQRVIPPFNYMEILKPRDIEFIKDDISAFNAFQSSASKAPEGGEDDLPF